MTANGSLRAKYVERLDVLIATGQELLNGVSENTTFRYSQDIDGQRRPIRSKKWYSIAQYGKYAEWCVSCSIIIKQLLSASGQSEGLADCFQPPTVDGRRVEQCLAVARSVRDNLALGFLDDLELTIAREVSADYVLMAGRLLQEGIVSEFDHVPAAVLAGAVLEWHLRKLCQRSEPPVSIFKDDGSPLMLNGLIDGLRKAKSITELKAKQLRAWADIRNQAAHGKFDEFGRNDVELMVKGIETFLNQL